MSSYKSRYKTFLQLESLLTDVDELDKEIADGEWLQAQARLTTAQDSLEAVHKFFDDKRNIIEQRLKEAAAAMRVFDIPELLELILTQLSFEDIIKASAVSHQFHDAIEASKKLQATLFLRADVSLAPSLVPVGLPKHWTHAIRYEAESGCYDVELVLDLGEKGDMTEFSLYTEINDRWKKTLVCQPPIYKMNVEIEMDWSGRDVVDVISLGRPLTFGDLHATALKEVKQVKKRGSELSVFFVGVAGH